MKFLNWLFGGKKTPLSKTKTDSYLDIHEHLFVESVIGALKTKPEHFSAKWFSGIYLDDSVRCKDRQILIMIESGQITQPIAPKMSKEQKGVVKKLLEPIVKRDSHYLIDKFVQNYQK